MKPKSNSTFTTLIYIITPVILLGVFLAYFNRYQAAYQLELQKQQAVEAEAAEKRRIEQAEMEKKLQDEAKKLAEAREQAAIKKELEEQQLRQDEINKLERSLANVGKEVADLDEKIGTYTAEVLTLRKQKKELDDKVWNLSRENENIRISKSTTDLESQRLVDGILNKVRTEWNDQLAAPPFVPPATTKR